MSGDMYFERSNLGNLLKERDCHCEACGWAPSELAKQTLRNWLGLIHSHHILPFACGGKDNRANIAHLCPVCHAFAHKLGSVRGPQSRVLKSWEGISTRPELLAKIRELRNGEDSTISATTREESHHA